MSKPLKLTIKSKDGKNPVAVFQGQEMQQTRRSSQYNVTIGNWTLGHGVTDFTLEMPADQKPKATITFNPDIIDIDVTVAGIQTLLYKVEE